MFSRHFFLLALRRWNETMTQLHRDPTQLRQILDDLSRRAGVSAWPARTLDDVFPAVFRAMERVRVRQPELMHELEGALSGEGQPVSLVLRGQPKEDAGTTARVWMTPWQSVTDYSLDHRSYPLEQLLPHYFAHVRRQVTDVQLAGLVQTLREQLGDALTVTTAWATARPRTVAELVSFLHQGYDAAKTLENSRMMEVGRTSARRPGLSTTS